MKTHFNGATALMMQYEKSSLHYEPEEFNKEMGRGGSTLDQLSLDEPTETNSNSRMMQLKKKSVGGLTKFTNGMDEFAEIN